MQGSAACSGVRMKPQDEGSQQLGGSGDDVWPLGGGGVCMEVCSNRERITGPRSGSVPSWGVSGGLSTILHAKAARDGFCS